MKILVSKFKGIDKGEVELDNITVFVGSNNSGKSSFIQAIQFAVSGGQTLTLNSVPWRKEETTRSSTFNSEEFLYNPTQKIEELHHREKLTQTSGVISISFEDNGELSEISFGKGRNKGITTKLTGKPIGDKLCSLEKPFCVYVPGIAGIPIEETYEPEIKVRKSAVRGNSNNFLRNILLRIRNNDDSEKWSRFTESLNFIYPNISLTVNYDENSSEYIDCLINFDDHTLSLDSIGTGVLQTIQIFAYMEYFSPRLLLLDEPDSHLHPTKQKLLAQEIQKRANENSEMRVVFSTHSMQLLRSLNSAKTYHFINGQPTESSSESSILLDIGALDADYLFSKPNLRYVLITEDKVDNVREKKNYIKHFLIAHGLSENEFVLHSYNGCKNMHTAGVLQELVQKHIPSSKVILHVDRDQRWTDEDPDIQILRSKAITHNIKLFITEFSEIENYFCQPSHVESVYSIGLHNADLIYKECLSELTNEVERKTKDFILNERMTLITDNKGRVRSEALEGLVATATESYYERICPGKELLSKLRAKLEERFSIHDHSLLIKASQGIKSKLFEELISE